MSSKLYDNPSKREWFANDVRNLSGISEITYLNSYVLHMSNHKLPTSGVVSNAHLKMPYTKQNPTGEMLFRVYAYLNNDISNYLAIVLQDKIDGQFGFKEKALELCNNKGHYPGNYLSEVKVNPKANSIDFSFEFASSHGSVYLDSEIKELSEEISVYLPVFLSFADNLSELVVTYLNGLEDSGLDEEDPEPTPEPQPKPEPIPEPKATTDILGGGCPDCGAKKRGPVLIHDIYCPKTASLKGPRGLPAYNRASDQARRAKAAQKTMNNKAGDIS